MKKSISFLFALVTLALAMAMTGCNKNINPEDQKHEPYVLYRFADNPYLAEVWWGDDYDPEYAFDYYCKKYNQPTSPKSGGACSSWHKDNFHGRNMDWMMYGYTTIIAHSPRTDKVKYASVSLMTGNGAMYKDFLDNNKTIPEDMRKYVLACAVDGINECGVVVNHNIVPYDGSTVEKNGKIASINIVRYILDNCATAKAAVDSLEHKAVTQALTGVGDYSHFHVSDKNSSYVIEWRGTEFKKTEFTSDGKGNYVSPKGQNAIMTNYFVFEAEDHGFETNEFFLSHPEAAGVERTKVIDSMLPGAKTVDDHLNICKAVWYKKFCEGKTDWATENAGYYGYSKDKNKCWWTLDGENINWVETDQVYEAAKTMINSEDMKGYYADFNKNWSNVLNPDNNYWFTQQSIVYDIAAKKGYLILMEGMFSNKVIEFSI